jgi:ornithine decarboxylase
MAGLFETEDIVAFGHSTPFFLFSKKRIREKYEEFKKQFPGAHIHYAMKANAEPELLKELAAVGSNFEVASKHELEILQTLKIPAERIVYGTSVKPAEHIAAFKKHGVDRFACDSFPELDKIAAHAPGARVYIRISVDDTGSVFKFSEKFGTEPQNAVALLVRAREIGLVPYGVSFHVGSQASNPKAWAEAIEKVGPILEELKRAGITLEVLDIGGGFPCAYASAEKSISLEEIAGHTLAAYKNLPYQPELILEPGRGIAAETAILVADIIARVERKEHTWLFLDVGVYGGLFETMAYQGSTRYRVTNLRPSYDAGEAQFAIAGPTGDSPDVITREALLPADVNVGDKLVFHDVGAYS